jgi:hypothetical protein
MIDKRQTISIKDLSLPSYCTEKFHGFGDAPATIREKQIDILIQVRLPTPITFSAGYGELKVSAGHSSKWVRIEEGLPPFV